MTNEMPKGGIQRLRDQVIRDLTDSQYPDVNDSSKNLIENTITLLQRLGKIQWQQPLPERVLILSPQELRSLADQAIAYGQITAAGGSRNMTDVPLHVYGRELAYLLMSPEGYFVEIRRDERTDWTTYEERTKRYGRFEQTDDVDEELDQ